MEDTREKILNFMRMRGPVLPIEVAKHIGTNTIISSAHLSELNSSGKLKISCIKVGGSPLYYIPGHEYQLQRFVDNLHEKEKKAYELLSSKKILRDSGQEPVMRVALRAIKDFAVPLEVNFKGGKEIFWRWHMIPNTEAESLIRPYFVEEKKVEPKPESIQEIIPEQKPVQKQESVVKEQKPLYEKKELAVPEKEEQKTLEKPKQPKKQMKSDKNDFLETISKSFSKNNITMLTKEIIRKGEIDFILKIPSAVGVLEYYCKAKDKKSINDGDLASAFAQGQLKKLPVLFITAGELTKRAKEILEKDFKGMNIMKI